MDFGTIAAGFAAQAQRRPSALAISSRDGELTYGELDRLARRHAALIANRGEADRAVVAILAERGPQVVVAALACLYAARPFAILDLAYPAERLRTLIDICRPGLALIAAAARPAIAGELGLPAMAVDLAPTDEGDERFEPRAAAPDAPAYLLFTSGSTGRPKCVACSHRPLVHFVDWQARTFGLTEADRFTLLSGLSHDPVLRDIFTPLSLGASIHIPTQATLTEPGGLLAWFAEVEPTVAHMTPPLGRLLTAARGPTLPDLRYVFWGGDVLRQELADALRAVAPACESINFYGATETPQAVSCHRVPASGGAARAPIGTAVDGFAIDIRGVDGRPAAQGESGEIVVRSRYLALGYVERGQLPEAAPDLEREYATGDIGYQRPDGQMVIQGRRDDQVKVRGYRVELAEITHALAQAPGVAQAITLNVGGEGPVRLACFVESSPGEDLEPLGLKALIARRLPTYMVPDDVRVLAAMPLLPNGKIDRQALIAGEAQRSAAAATDDAPPPASEVEARLLRHWRTIFRPDAVTPDASFAALGGDSLSYVSAYLSLEEALGEVPSGWTTMTLAELAASAKSAARRGAFVQVESAIVMRAIAISAVVASHFQLIFTGGGATSALMWVSGFLFGGLQLAETDHQRSLTPLGRLLRSLLVPLYLIELPQVLVKFATHYHARLSSVLLYTDLLDYTGDATSGPDAYGGHEYLMWYVHCIVHMLFIYAALVLVCRYVLKLRRPGLWAGLSALGFGFVARFALPAALDPTFGRQAVDGMSFFGHSPTTHLATFALAALTGFLKGRRRWLMLAAALAYAAISAPLFGWTDSVSIAFVAGLLALAPGLRLPRRLTKPVYLVAGASFFIYLLQFKFLAVFTHLHLPLWLAWPATLAGGVAAWGAWTWSAQRSGAAWTRLRRWLPARGAGGLGAQPSAISLR